MLRIYQRLWQVTWAEQWQYRANLLMYLFYWIVSPVVYLAVWTSIAQAQGGVRGYTSTDFTNYYLILLMIDQLTADITIHTMAYKIQDGTLSGDLLKPIHPVLTSALVSNLAFKALGMMVMVPVWVGLVLLFRPDFSAVTFQSLLVAAPAVGLGFLINFLFGAAITSLAFWTTRVYSIAEFYFALMVLFAGQFVPLDLMPPIVQQISRFMPFPVMRYFPIQLILGRVSPSDTVWYYAVGLVWLGIALGIFSIMWRKGLKRFSAVGA